MPRPLGHSAARIGENILVLGGEGGFSQAGTTAELVPGDAVTPVDGPVYLNLWGGLGTHFSLTRPSGPG